MTLIGLALAALLSAPAAQAATASASLGPIQFQLVDLDKQDGISAAITFASGVTTDVTSSTFDFTTSTLQSNQLSKSGWFQTLSQTDSGTYGFAFAGARNKKLTAFGNAADGGSFFAAASSSQSQEGFALFTLTPHTQVTISFQASVSASIFNQCGSFNCDSAQASSGLFGTFFSNDGQSSQDVSAMLNVALSAAGGPLDGSFASQSANQKFTITLSNPYDTTASLYNAFVGIQVSGFGGTPPGGAQQTLTALSSVTAVPEPATNALLLAGLGAIALVARRRKS